MFANDQLIGGYDELQALEDSGRLDTLLAECQEGPHETHFPPPLRKPASDEFLQVSINLY